MQQPPADLLEIILRECAAAGIHPWYPAAFVEATGLPREAVEKSLDQLRLNGLVHLTPWVQGQGQGYQLTAHGLEVLEHPRLLGRLRRGETLPAPQQSEPPQQRHALEGMRGEEVRKALLDDSRPIVTRCLLWANIFWFLVGSAVYMHRGGEFMEYVTASGGQQLSEAYQTIGSLARFNIAIDHEWWRLLSYGFIHGGVLHLFMNMYALYVIGPLLERMWGRAVYLAIYLVSCIGGGALAMVLTPQGNLIGASGAICGLLGSMLTWLILNKRHLPDQLVSHWQRNIVTNIVLIAIISMLPGVSWAGHLGGGAAGVIIAIPLNLARFAKGAQRWLGWAAAVAITFVGLCLTDYALTRHRAAGGFATDAAARAEVLRALKSELKTLARAEEVADEAAKLESSVLRFEHQRPPEEKAQTSREKLVSIQKQLVQAASKLSQAKPFQQPDLAATMKAGVSYVNASASLCGKTAKALEPDAPWPPPDWNTLREDMARVEELRQALGRAWRPLQGLLASPD